MEHDSEVLPVEAKPRVTLTAYKRKVTSTVMRHIRSRLTIKLDRLIVLSKSSLLGWFLQVSLIVIIKGRSPMEVSLNVKIKLVPKA